MTRGIANEGVERPPTVIEGEVLSITDLMPRPLQYPPAVRPAPEPEPEPAEDGCACGKDGSDHSHGAIREGMRPMSCEEVLAIEARVAFTEHLERLLPWQRLRAWFDARFRGQAPEGWR